MLAKAMQSFAVAIMLTLGAGTAFAQSALDPAAGAPPRTPQPVSTRANTAALSPSNEYRLGPGDRVRITVYGQNNLTGEYSVDGNGMLAFPLIGQLQAGGMTAGELQRAITDKLSPDYIKDPSVSAEVLTYRPFYILGEVRTPGSYPYVNGMAILNAIALAGGFTYRAQEEKFYITRIRDGRREKVAATPETDVLPGDIITVRERYF